MSFMDAYSGYNQFQMHPNDHEKISFVPQKGIYCYKVMLFKLNNVGSTYQRSMNKIFSDKLGNTIVVYIDYMLVKATLAGLHVDHLNNTFQMLKNYNMKLNPTKGNFGVKAGRFLPYQITKRGIEANQTNSSRL